MEVAEKVVEKVITFPPPEFTMEITQYKTNLAGDDRDIFQNVCTYFAILTGYLFMNTSTSKQQQMTHTFKELGSLCPKLNCKIMSLLHTAHQKLIAENISQINAAQRLSTFNDSIPFNMMPYKKNIPNVVADHVYSMMTVNDCLNFIGNVWYSEYNNKLDGQKYHGRISLVCLIASLSFAILFDFVQEKIYFRDSHVAGQYVFLNDIKNIVGQLFLHLLRTDRVDNGKGQRAYLHIDAEKDKALGEFIVIQHTTVIESKLVVDHSEKAALLYNEYLTKGVLGVEGIDRAKQLKVDEEFFKGYGITSDSDKQKITELVKAEMQKGGAKNDQYYLKYMKYKHKYMAHK